MDTKHTPGPWTAKFSFPALKPGIGDTWQIDCDGHAVCTTQFCYAPDTEANARLIAAAPELLEALIEMEREKSDYMTRNNLGDPAKEHTNKIARAAIAKATGESQ